jgi:hypothetical protein
MRCVLAQVVAAAALLNYSYASAQTSQACTGLCQLQVSCPAGQTTSISGTVYAPNGTDPLPNVLVYIPNAPVDTFTAGVSCPLPGQPPSGSPLVGANTAADGTFTLVNVPVGSNIPLVIQSGRWRRQLTVPGTAACTDTSFSPRMPRNQSEGDIPKIAIASGSVDQIECVLRKVGIADTEFTNPLGTGRINLYSGDGGPNAPGARIDASTPTEAALMDNIANLKQYDVLMLPCEGSAIIKSSTRLSNFVQYANAGGRVYASHYSYVWMFNNPPFNTVVNWRVGQATLPDGIANVDTTFPDGKTLATWLQLVGASTTLGQMPITVLRHDFNGVVPPTQSWLTLDNAGAGNPVMQFTFDTPVGAPNQCGRILFNEYHVENPPAGTTPTNKAFPTECPDGAMTPQEKLLEYSLFDLTNQGGEPTLDPTSADFGTEPVGFTTASKNFTLKNNSIFALSGITAIATGDFLVTSNGCANVPAGGTCQVGVAFKPAVTGSRTGILTVQSNAKSLTATLTGTGVPAVSVSSTTLTFGNVDVGASTTRSVTLTNTAPGTVSIPPLTISGDYAVASTCTTIPAGSSCAVNITFKPGTTGTRTGTLTVSAGDPAAYNLPVQLTGNGVDFTIGLSPTSGSVIAGLGTQTTATVSPVAGFASSVTLSCTTTTPGSTCTTSLVSFIPSSPVPVVVAITTTSQYTVIGYGGFFPLLAFFSGTLLWLARRKARTPALFLLGALVLTATCLFTTGCSGKYPDKNAVYTAPGSYTYTITATDGIITHSSTYSLGVAAK